MKFENKIVKIEDDDDNTTKYGILLKPLLKLDRWWQKKYKPTPSGKICHYVALIDTQKCIVYQNEPYRKINIYIKDDLNDHDFSIDELINESF